MERHRDFYRGQEAVIGTMEGLPGVPGQPKGRAEAQGFKERLTRALEGHIEEHGNRWLEEEETNP